MTKQENRQIQRSFLVIQLSNARMVWWSILFGLGFSGLGAYMSNGWAKILFVGLMICNMGVGVLLEKLMRYIKNEIDILNELDIQESKLNNIEVNTDGNNN
jgi:hypothetical protein